MKVTEYAELLNDKPLLEYQKKLLEFMMTLPKDSKVVYGRYGKIYFIKKDKMNEQ